MSTKHLKQIIFDYLKGTDFEEINNVISIQRLWIKTLGKPIINNTEIKSFKNGIITVKVSSPVWRNELSLQKQIILKKLQKNQSDLIINKIILK